MDHCGNQALDAAELKYTVAKLSNRCIPPKPSKGNEAYTGRGSVCSGKKRKQKIQEVLQKPPPMLKTQASSPENKGIISALLKFVRGRKREEKPLAEEKDTREGLKGECLTESDFSFEGSPKVSSSPDFDGTENKEVKVYRRWGKSWHSMKLKQPATFAELGMDPENEGIISDILRFVRDKEIYRKEGKPWKRVYYLFDSPGTTDRSSFIAAMANCVEFDIYDLNLTGLTSISELTNVLASIRSRSLIAIKDFDYWAGKIPYLKNELTLSGLSKIIHGLLSSYGDEQIIVLITNHNHIDGVDAALLRSLNNDLYIHMPSPQPKALSNGGEIVLLDSSEQKPMVDFDATNNRAYQRDVLVSNSEEKNTIEASRRQCMPEGVPSLVDLLTRLSLTVDGLDSNAHDMHVFVQSSTIATSSQSSTIATSSQGPPIATSARITKDDLQRLHGSMTRKDAAAILRVSLSTVKRKCREYKIGPWKNGGRKRVLRTPDKHGEGNTSTARETPSHNVQIGMEGEPVGQNQEANECRQDFMVSRPPDQHGERNTLTARETPSHNVQTGTEGVLVGQNQEANEFGPERENTGRSFGWASQVNDQSALSNPHVAFPQPQITSLQSENRGDSIDLRNSAPSQAELFSDGHISGSSNLAFPTWSDQAAPSQHVGGQAMQSTDHNAFVFPQTQTVSPQEPFPAGHVFEFCNWNNHTNSVKIKAFYGEAIYKFLFPLTSGIDDLKKEVSKRLNVEVDRFVVKYMDEYGHLISIPCNEDWMLYLSSSWGNDEIRVFVHDRTTNFCESCRSSMQRRA